MERDSFYLICIIIVIIIIVTVIIIRSCVLAKVWKKHSDHREFISEVFEIFIITGRFFS